MRPLTYCLMILCLAYTVGSQFPRRTPKEGGRSCRTPDAKPGNCSTLKDCPVLFDLFIKHRSDPVVAEHLRRSVCDSEGRYIKVCCPAEENQGIPSPGIEPSRGSTGLPSPPNCGIAGDHPKIVGGQPSALGAWPWMAALGYRNKTHPGPFWKCGGSLINANYIVTAAHCVKVRGMTLFVARLGDLDLDKNVKDGANPVDVRIERSILHPKYTPSKFTDDIALVKLSQDVTLSNLIQPICLPVSPELRSENFDRKWPFVAGWGTIAFKGPSSTRLMEIQVPVVPNDVCKKAFSGNVVIVSSQICAGGTSKKTDACRGDSGGPLMFPKGKNYYLIGVVSFGYRCAEPGFPGVYTRVTDYVDWISDNIK